MNRDRQIERLETAIEAQKRFVHTVPDPDNRQLAEANLMTLVFKRDLYITTDDCAIERIIVR